MNLLAIFVIAATTWLNATPRDIPAIAKSLPDADAIRQLVTVGGTPAERALLDALPQSQGSNTVALLKALGDLRSADAVTESIRHLDSGASGDLKDICLYALSRTTSTRAARWLRAHADADTAVATAYLRHGESLLALGRVREPAAVALDLLHAKSPAVRCGAVLLFADVRGYAAQPTLLAMLDDADRAVREQAARQLTRMPRAVGLVAAFRAAKGERRALLFAAIARRTDADTGFLVQSLADADETVRRTAASALRNISGTQVDAAIAAALASPDSQAAALGLLAARRARSQVAAVMPLLNSPASKPAFAALAVLAGEPEIHQLIAAAVASTDESFRGQAAKAIAAAAPRLPDNARCVAALKNVPEMFRPWALALLPSFGGKAALDAVVAGTTGADRDGAVRALADWRDASALEPLLALCRDATEEKVRVLAARGAIRIVGVAELDQDAKADWLNKIAAASPRAAEKQQALAALEQLKSKPEPVRRKKK